MSRGPENTFIGGVHKHLPPDLYRMKNHNEFNSGIADCWYSGLDGDLWVEYKFLEVPKRSNTMIVLTDIKKPYSLTTLQQEWLKDRYAEGRSVGVIVGSSSGGIWLPGIRFLEPLTAQEFNDAMKTRRELAELISQLTYG